MCMTTPREGECGRSISSCRGSPEWAPQGRPREAFYRTHPLRDMICCHIGTLYQIWLRHHIEWLHEMLTCAEFIHCVQFSTGLFMLCLCWICLPPWLDTPSENTGLWQLPKVSTALKCTDLQRSSTWWVFSQNNLSNEIIPTLWVIVPSRDQEADFIQEGWCDMEAKGLIEDRVDRILLGRSLLGLDYFLFNNELKFDKRICWETQ